MKPPLCVPCAAERTAWLDYRLPPILSFTYGNGAAYDTSTAGVRDRRRARFEQWRSTVRFQMDLIARQCRAGRHAEPQRQAARVVQLDLFDALDQLEGAA